MQNIFSLLLRENSSRTTSIKDFVSYLENFRMFGLKYDVPWSEFVKYGLSFGVMYGMQRTFGKKQRGFYDLGAGISYTPYRRSKFLPELKARIGLRLTKISE